MTGHPSDADYDAWLDAIADDGGTYLACANGHGWLPPRRVCPECGDRELTEHALPETGTVETYTVVHTAAPDFADDVPYVTAVVDFGPVRLTGVVVDCDPADVAVDDAVTVDVGATESTGEPLVVFRHG